MNPACDIANLREGLQEVAKEIQKYPEAIDLYASGFNGIKISNSAGYISYRDDEEFSKAINWAMQVGVNPAKSVRQRERQPTSRLFLDVKNTFTNFGWIAKPSQGISAHKIIPRYSLSSEEGLTVDFALKNGHMNCIQTIDYRNANSTKKTEAQAKLLTLGFSHQLFDDAQAYAVIAGALEPESKSILKLAERTVDDLFIHESAEDMDRLINQISKAIGQDAMPQLTT